MLVGCASGPEKKIMTNADYQGFARGFVWTHACHEKGLLSTELAAKGVGMMQTNLSTTLIYNPEDLKASIEMMRDAVRTEPLERYRSRCSEMAIHIQSAANQWAAKEQDSAQSMAAFQQAARNFQLNKPIFCSTIGNMTMCN